MQNTRDFLNLLSVYTDAAFFPRLRLTDFRQEGHRLEWGSGSEGADGEGDEGEQPEKVASEIPSNGEKKLVYKG